MRRPSPFMTAMRAMGDRTKSARGAMQQHGAEKGWKEGLATLKECWGRRRRCCRRRCRLNKRNVAEPSRNSHVHLGAGSTTCRAGGCEHEIGKQISSFGAENPRAVAVRVETDFWGTPLVVSMLLIAPPGFTLRETSMSVSASESHGCCTI
eukprot:756235-Amphidinium_carterae.2